MALFLQPPGRFMNLELRSLLTNLRARDKLKANWMKKSKAAAVTLWESWNNCFSPKPEVRLAAHPICQRIFEDSSAEILGNIADMAANFSLQTAEHGFRALLGVAMGPLGGLVGPLGQLLDPLQRVTGAIMVKIGKRAVTMGNRSLHRMARKKMRKLFFESLEDCVPGRGEAREDKHRQFFENVVRLLRAQWATDGAAGVIHAKLTEEQAKFLELKKKFCGKEEATEQEAEEADLDSEAEDKTTLPTAALDNAAEQDQKKLALSESLSALRQSLSTLIGLGVTERGFAEAGDLWELLEMIMWQLCATGANKCHVHSAPRDPAAHDLVVSFLGKFHFAVAGALMMDVLERARERAKHKVESLKKKGRNFWQRWRKRNRNFWEHELLATLDACQSGGFHAHSQRKLSGPPGPDPEDVIVEDERQCGTIDSLGYAVLIDDSESSLDLNAPSERVNAARHGDAQPQEQKTPGLVYRAKKRLASCLPTGAKKRLSHHGLDGVS
jgi:hypothetical protein